DPDDRYRVVGGGQAVLTAPSAACLCTILRRPLRRELSFHMLTLSPRTQADASFPAPELFRTRPLHRARWPEASPQDLRSPLPSASIGPFSPSPSPPSPGRPACGK